MKAKAFDKKFGEGKDISRHLDVSKARKAGEVKPPRRSAAVPLVRGTFA